MAGVIHYHCRRCLRRYHGHCFLRDDVVVVVVVTVNVGAVFLVIIVIIIIVAGYGGITFTVAGAVILC